MNADDRKKLERFEQKLDDFIDASINDKKIMHEKIDNLTKKHERVYAVIAGDKLQGDGLIVRVSKLEKDVGKQKNINWVIATLITIGGAIAGFWGQIKNLINS